MPGRLLAVLLAIGVALAPRTPWLLAQPSEPIAPVEPQAPASEAAAAIPPTKPSSPSAEVDVAGFRLREGTHFTNRLGRFRMNGDVLTFIDEGNREIGGLPNLNLERIIRMLKTVEEPQNIWWSVSGVITEFSDRNYLLISRAVYKAAAPPPAPESLPGASGPAAP